MQLERRRTMPNSKWTQLVSALTLMLCAIPAGCATTTVSVVQTDGVSPAAFCRTAKPIYWSPRDTDETIRQAKEHKAVGKKLCGWK